MKKTWTTLAAVALLAFAEPGTVLGGEQGAGAPPAIEERERLLALSREQGEAAVIELATALEDGRTLVRRTAAHLLARSGETARPTLLAALEHNDSQVRRIAMEAMGREWLLTQHLRQAAGDPDPAVGAWVWAYLAQGGDELEGLLRHAAKPFGDFLAEAEPPQREQALRFLAQLRGGAEPLYQFAADTEEILAEWRVRKDTDAGRQHARAGEYLRQPQWESLGVSLTPEGGLRFSFQKRGRLQFGAWPAALRGIPPGPYVLRFAFRQEFPDPEQATGISLRVALRNGEGLGHYLLRPLPRLAPGESLSQAIYLDPAQGESFRIRFDINMIGPGTFTVEDVAVVPLLQDGHGRNM